MGGQVNGYRRKSIGIKIVRAILPLALKMMPSSPDPDVKPSSTKSYTCKNRKRQINVYLPQPAIEGPLPIHINLHGSGFTLLTFGRGDAYFCSRVANEVGCVVLDVDHSKGPEDPWPCAVEDVDAAIAWARETAEKEGWDANRVSIGGFSSGGCLALVAASNPSNRLKGVVAFYPSTNLAESAYDKPQVKPAKGQAGGTAPPMFRRFTYSCYLHRDQDRAHPKVSPYHAPAESFSPATIITCSGDSLAREAKQLVDKLKEANMDAQHYEAEGQGHDWDHQIKDLNSKAGQMREKAYGLAIERLRAQLRHQ